MSTLQIMFNKRWRIFIIAFIGMIEAIDDGLNGHNYAYPADSSVEIPTFGLFCVYALCMTLGAGLAIIEIPAEIIRYSLFRPAERRYALFIKIMEFPEDMFPSGVMFKREICLGYYEQYVYLKFYILLNRFFNRKRDDEYYGALKKSIEERDRLHFNCLALKIAGVIK